MIVLSYDISNDKLRSHFSKFLTKYGHRIQYSVFEIDNSPSMLSNIICQIRNKFEKRFSESDSVIIFNMSNSCEVLRFGYAKHEESDIIMV